VAEPIDPDDLIDANEVAAILGLSRRTSVSVYRSRYAGSFPAPVIERGRCTLWARSAVEEWARSRASS
jgi:predicted DNA-binding transcriptional regulator AlpA